MKSYSPSYLTRFHGDLQVSTFNDETRHQRRATVRGALEGELVGTEIALPAFYLLNKRSTHYRSFPFPVKLLGSVIVAPLVTIQAERRTLDFDYQPIGTAELGKTQLEKREHEEQERWAALSGKDKAIVGSETSTECYYGSWATTMAVAGSVIMRDSLLTMPQKVVQVRLWAQGLAIGVVIATATLTHAQGARVVEMRKHGRRSWQYAPEDERLEKGPRKTSSA